MDLPCGAFLGVMAAVCGGRGAGVFAPSFGVVASSSYAEKRVCED